MTDLKNWSGEEQRARAEALALSEARVIRRAADVIVTQVESSFDRLSLRFWSKKLRDHLGALDKLIDTHEAVRDLPPGEKG